MLDIVAGYLTEVHTASLSFYRADVVLGLPGQAHRGGTHGHMGTWAEQHKDRGVHVNLGAGGS